MDKDGDLAEKRASFLLSEKDMMEDNSQDAMVDEVATEAVGATMVEAVARSTMTAERRSGAATPGVIEDLN